MTAGSLSLTTAERDAIEHVLHGSNRQPQDWLRALVFQTLRKKLLTKIHSNDDEARRLLAAIREEHWPIAAKHATDRLDEALFSGDDGTPPLLLSKRVCERLRRHGLVTLGHLLAVNAADLGATGFDVNELDERLWNAFGVGVRPTTCPLPDFLDRFVARESGHLLCGVALTIAELAFIARVPEWKMRERLEAGDSPLDAIRSLAQPPTRRSRRRKQRRPPALFRELPPPPKNADQKAIVAWCRSIAARFASKAALRGKHGEEYCVERASAAGHVRRYYKLAYRRNATDELIELCGCRVKRLPTRLDRIPPPADLRDTWAAARWVRAIFDDCCENMSLLSSAKAATWQAFLRVYGDLAFTVIAKRAGLTPGHQPMAPMQLPRPRSRAPKDVAREADQEQAAAS